MTNTANEKWKKFIKELTALQVKLADPKLTEVEEEIINIEIKELVQNYHGKVANPKPKRPV